MKYRFSISGQDQQLRFLLRVQVPMKQWKLGPTDLQSRLRWEQYSKAKQEMLERTSIPEAHWWIVEGNDKKRARSNRINHFLDQVPCEGVPHTPSILPDRVFNPDYQGKVPREHLYVPAKF